MKGHEVQAGAAEEDRKRLLLERFQMEVRPLLAHLLGALPCAGPHAGPVGKRHPFREQTHLVVDGGSVVRTKAPRLKAYTLHGACIAAGDTRLGRQRLVYCLTVPQLDSDAVSITRGGHCVQHPGMDFSGAAVQGEAPDPAKFMGGFEKQ